MTFDELYELTLKEFPNLPWQKVIYSIGGEEVVSAKAKVNHNKYEFHLSNFDISVNDGCQFISTSHDSELRGTSCPCITWEEAKEWMTVFIKKYDPKLLEEQQLSLF